MSARKKKSKKKLPKAAVFSAETKRVHAEFELAMTFDRDELKRARTLTARLGGLARAQKLSPERRKEIAINAIKTRYSKHTQKQKVNGGEKGNRENENNVLKGSIEFRKI